MKDYGILASYAGILGLATFSVCAGAFASLPKSPKQSHKTDTSLPIPEEEEEDDVDIEVERLSSSDAWLLPIIGSVLLGGLYLVIKYGGREWLNWFMRWYFSIAGIGAVWNSSTSFMKVIIGSSRWKSFDNIRVNISKGSKSLLNFSMKEPAFYLIPISVLPSIIYTFVVEKRLSVLVSNILALSFSFTMFPLMKLDGFKAGIILLSGLFLYDIWWVFGTRVMVDVATKLDVPIKLMWPKALSMASDQGYTMLGLGDIQVPGMFISLCLRYDYFCFSQSRSEKAEKAARAFRKPYFYACVVAYVVGLITTVSVMHLYHAAQPALLYLSPACILSFLITALLRGELSHAFGWSDSLEDPDSSSKSAGAGSDAHEKPPSTETKDKTVEESN